MRIMILASLALIAATPALAYQTGAAALERAPKEGEVLRDGSARIVGKVTKVQASGAVLAIVNGQAIRIPAETLSIVDGKLVTTLTKTEALKLK